MIEKRTITAVQFWTGMAVLFIPLIWAASALAANNAATNHAQDIRDDQLEARVSRLETAMEGLQTTAATTRNDVDWIRKWAEGRK